MSITERESPAEPQTDEPGLDVADAVSRAVGEFERKLLRYAQSWVGQLESAQDVVQETFLQLHRQAQNHMPPSLAAWLFTVCRNRAIDWCRRQQRANSTTNLENSELDDATAVYGAESPVECLIRDESHEKLREQLACLTTTQQEAMRLRFQGGLSYQEIAQVTGMTTNHVGVTIHAALQKLRERMAGTEPIA